MKDSLAQLTENYLQDIQELKIHLKHGEDFLELLERQKLQKPEEKLTEEDYDLLEKGLTEFSIERTRQFEALEKRDLDSAKLLKESRLSSGEGINEKYRRLSQARGEIMEKILAQDEIIIPILKKEITRVRMELQRIQEGARSKQVYQGQTFSEARFIDKMK